MTLRPILIGFILFSLCTLTGCWLTDRTTEEVVNPDGSITVIEHPSPLEEGLSGAASGGMSGGWIGALVGLITGVAGAGATAYRSRNKRDGLMSEVVLGVGKFFEDMPAYDSEMEWEKIVELEKARLKEHLTKATSGASRELVDYLKRKVGLK